MNIDSVYYSWTAIYKLTGLCKEDFQYDYTGSYTSLIKVIDKGNE